jgi:hypothetical protein
LFVISIPVAIFMPFNTIILGLGAFWVVNKSLCYPLNGSDSRLYSNPKYTGVYSEEHAEEQWIFLNGIGVGYSSRPKDQLLLLTRVNIDHIGCKATSTV